MELQGSIRLGKPKKGWGAGEIIVVVRGVVFLGPWGISRLVKSDSLGSRGRVDTEDMRHRGWHGERQATSSPFRHQPLTYQPAALHSPSVAVISLCTARNSSHISMIGLLRTYETLNSSRLAGYCVCILRGWDDQAARTQVQTVESVVILVEARIA
jgi:hypothetical protein